MFRAWLLELDPSGRYEQYVRLGGQTTIVKADDRLSFEEDGAREDTVLTGRLTADFDEVFSNSVICPACPLCGGHRITRKGFERDVPKFLCKACQKIFNRRTNTAYQGYKDIGKFREFIRYLSLPLALTQTAEIFDTDPRSVRRWIGMFVRRCNEIAPSGKLLSSVRLAVRPTSKTPCAFCGIGRFVIFVEGRAVCSSCRRLFSMRRDVFEHDGTLYVGRPRWDNEANRPVSLDCSHHNSATLCGDSP